MFLRFFYPAPLIAPIRINNGGGRGDYVLTENRRLIYVPIPFSGDFNSEGLRGTEYPISKEIGKHRVIFLGDSVVQGYGIANPNTRFTELLQKKIDSKYEIINMGVAGYNLIQEIEYFKLRGDKYRPDTVIFGITFNDLEINSGEVDKFSKQINKADTNYFYKAIIDWKKDVFLPLSRFSLYRYYYIFTNLNHFSISRGNTSFHDSIYYKMDASKVKKLLHEFVDYSKNQDFRVSIVFLPVKSNFNQMRLLRKVIENDSYLKTNISYIDLNNDIVEAYGEDYKKRFYLNKNDICHLNEQGHKIVAKLVFNKWGLIVGDSEDKTNK